MLFNIYIRSLREKGSLFSKIKEKIETAGDVLIYLSGWNGGAALRSSRKIDDRADWPSGTWDRWIYPFHLA